MTTTGPLVDNLLLPELVADPYPALARLRAEDPVHWNGRSKAWMLTRYDDVVAAFRDPRLSAERLDDLRLGEGPDAGAGDFAPLVEWMVFKDPPDHTRLRKLVQPPFTRRVAETLRARVAILIDELIDGLKGTRQTDFIASFAHPLPASVIAELMGVPAQDRIYFQGWSSKISGLIFGALDDPDRYTRGREGLAELSAYFTDLLAERRAAPTDDLLSLLAQAREAGDRLTSDEVVATCVLLLFAGHETTTNMLGSGLVALLDHPDQLERLKQHPELAPLAVEELLRYDGPSKLMVRWVQADFALRGREIKAGQRVFLVQAAANRDPEIFADPDGLDLGRQDNQHLGFGFGIHYCLGAPLARLELQIAFPALLRRIRGLRLGPGPLDWSPVLLNRGLRSLAIEYDEVV